MKHPIELKRGDLVLADDYFGIVMGQYEVFLSNGLHLVFNLEGWEALIPIQLPESTATANFQEIMK